MPVATELSGFNINDEEQYLLLPILITSDDKYSFTILGDFFECEVVQGRKDTLTITTYLDEANLGEVINVHGVEITNDATEKFKGVIDIKYQFADAFEGRKLVLYKVNIRTDDDELIRYLNAIAYLHFQHEMNKSLEQIKKQ